MADAILVVDHHYGPGNITNPDGTVKATASGTTPIAGPGFTSFGTFNNALSFTGGAHVIAKPPANKVDARRFNIKIYFAATAAVTKRATLFESALPGCSVSLLPAAGSGDYRVEAKINNVRNGWSGIDTISRAAFKLNSWYMLEVAFDRDTLGIFLNNLVIATSAWPDGNPVPATNAEFIVGVGADKTSFPFTGKIALVQTYNGIPANLQSSLDNARSTAEWQIRLKENTLLPAFSLGNREGDIFMHLSGMQVQKFVNATICYGSGMPAAFVIHGPIRDRWDGNERIVMNLGALVSDVIDAKAPGSKRSVFTGGAIYWSERTGAWEVVGRSYIDYEQMGASVSQLGLPVSPPDAIADGTVQFFQFGRMYFKAGAGRAYAVVGEILKRYLDTGGVVQWGFPISDEEPVFRTGTNALAITTGARLSRFERCTFFWSANTGAHEVHGAILEKYLLSGGPGMPNDDQFNGLGLPLTDETNFPAWAGFGRYNMFEHGSIVWNGGNAQICTAFNLHFGLVQTQEDEGWTQGENDLFFNIRVSRNGVGLIDDRVPDSDAFDDDNSHDLDYAVNHDFVPNDPELRIAFSIDVWDEDGGFGFKENKLGTFATELNISNGWGLFKSPTGTFAEMGISKIDRLEWQVKPRQPKNAVKDFWETTNKSTDNLTYPQYSAAFADIDDDPEWTDPSDWAQKEVFSRLIKGAASTGNCFGFCTEALYAWHARNYGLPLARFKESDWETIRNTINIKQIYWLGSDNLAHVADQRENFMSARDIFLETRDRFIAGDPSVISMFANADYTGAGHSVLPFAWNDTVSPWVITVYDPNAANAATTIQVTPSGFSFNNRGIALSGSMNFTPWSAVDHRQCSPAWDPNMLLLALLIVVVGADGETTSLTDGNGGNLYMPHNQDREGRSRQGQFTPMGALNGELNGELLVRKVRPAQKQTYSFGDALNMKLSELQYIVQSASRIGEDVMLNPQPLPPKLARLIAEQEFPEAMKNIRLHDLLQQRTSYRDQLLSGTAELNYKIDPISAIGEWAQHQSTIFGPDFTHEIRGKQRGKFDYLTRWRLTETRMKSKIEKGEMHKFNASGLSGNLPLYRLTTERDKLVNIEHTVRLGRGSDFARILLEGVPARKNLSVNFSVSSGMSSIDIISAGDRLEVPVLIETWRGATKNISRFNATMEGGLRLTPSINEPGSALKVAEISNLFGAGGASQLLQPL